MFIVDMSFEMQQLHQMERKSYQFKTTAGKGESYCTTEST